MEKGTLYIIATPIGNLEDITLRALRILREDISRVFCEDTRRSRILLNNYGISLPALSLHSHSPAKRIESALAHLLKGENVAYMTDSGTPGLSDPGSALVAGAHQNGIPVVPVPGPSALGAILSVAGFPEKNVLFGGFLSKKEGKRVRELESFRNFRGIIVVYESPYRITKLLADIGSVFPDSDIVIGREMTKRYEEYLRGKASDLAGGIGGITEKGEFTVAIHNVP